MCFLLLLAGALAWGLSCGRPPTPRAASSAADTLAASAARADTLATLRRTPCFGPCPSYTLTIYEDGTVVYEGDRFVVVEDTVQDRLSQEALERLVAAFREADYFALQDAYIAGRACARLLTDFPTVITSLHREGRHKRIEHYHGCQGFPGEERLTALEDTLDAIAGTARWVEGEEK